MPLDVYIEALLFYKSAPQSKNKLVKMLEVSEADLRTALDVLKERLQAGAIRLVETETEIQLATAPELSTYIEALRKQDLAGDIGKAGAETLAIVLYKEPVTRSEIDRIRGVNSSFILRNLMTRGLVAREATGGNSFHFRTTPQLLQHLGVTHKHELPQFSDFMNVIDTFDKTES